MDGTAIRVALSRPMHVSRAVALLAAFSLLSVEGGASAQASDDEYDAAICMDRYNTDKAFRQDQSKTRENPFLDARVKADGFHGAILGADVPGGGHYGLGGTFDADTLIGLLSSAHSTLGATIGLSAGGYSVPQHAYGFGGQVRFGLARRRFSAAQLDWISRFFAHVKLEPHACRFERTELKLDFLRWGFMQVKDTSGAPGAFVSTVSTLALSWGFIDVDGGFRATVEPARFRLAPSVQWGPRLEVERIFGPVVFGVALGCYADTSRADAYAVLSTGFHFEYGNGVSAK